MAKTKKKTAKKAKVKTVKKAKTVKAKTVKAKTSSETPKEAKPAAKKAAKTAAVKKPRKKRTSRLNSKDASPVLETGVSRLKFIANWKASKDKENAKAERRLNSYVDRLVKKYPGDYLDKIKEALEDESKFSESLDEIYFDAADTTEAVAEEEDEETEREFLEKFSRNVKVTE